MEIVLRDIHSYIRWIALLVALVALVKLVIGLVKKSPYDSMTRGLMSAFSGILDLNAALGIVLLIVGWNTYTLIAGGFPRHQVEHLTVVIFAVVVSHLPMRWKDKPDALRYRNGIIVIVGALLLIGMAIFVLEGNRWVFRGFGG